MPRTSTTKITAKPDDYSWIVFEVWVRGIGGFTRDRAFLVSDEAHNHAKAWCDKGEITRVYKVELALDTTYYPKGLQPSDMNNID